MKAHHKVINAIFFSFFLLLLDNPCANAAVTAAPAGLTALAGNGEISLTWNNLDGATSYILYRSQTSAGPYSFVAWTGGTGQTDRGLSNGQAYYYVVTALNADGQSPYSAEVSEIPTLTVLPAPSGLKAIPGNGETSLTWNAVTSAVSYNVYRATSPGGPYTQLTPTAPGLSFTDRGLVNGTAYYYVVQTQSTNKGAYSEEVIAAPSALLPLAPAVFTAAPGSTWADLSWTASDGATSYVVYRGTNKGGPYDFAATRPNTTAYEDMNLSNGTTYYYVVAAVNAKGQGAFSPEAIAAVSANKKPHAAILKAAFFAGSAHVYLSWDPAAGATSYAVLKASASGGPYEIVTTQTSTGYDDSNVINGTTYYYVVDTHNASATVARSNEVAKTPVALWQAPAPVNVAVIPGNTQATVTWDPVPGVTQYYVEAATSPGGQLVAWAGNSYGPGVTVQGLTDGIMHYFRIQALGSSWSAFSTNGSTTPTYTLPLAPTNLNVQVVGNRQLSLTWTAVEGATSYAIYRWTEGAAWPSLPVGTATGTLFNDTELVNGTRYYYAVAAVNESGSGAWSSETYGTPNAISVPAPVNVGVIPGNTQATVTWDLVAGATQYFVTVADSPGGPYISGGGASSPGLTFQGLTNAPTHYYFRVQALGTGNQWSAFSAEASATLDPSLPLAPTGLNVQPGNTQLSLTWVAVDGATSYNIYRRTEEATWPTAPLATVTGTLYNDRGLMNGTRYYYAVAAVNESGRGALSNETYGMPTARSVPAPVNVAVFPGYTQITVTWDAMPGVTSYYVTLSNSPGGSYVTGGPTQSPSFTQPGLTNDTTYYFRVQALGSSGWSAFSAETSATPAVSWPLAPTNLGIIPGNAQISITWQDVTGATSYHVYRRAEGSSWPAEPVGTVTGTLFNDTGLANGSRYYYAVAAVKGGNSGAWSNETYGTPTADAVSAPVNVAATPANYQATVTWSPLTGATSYYVTVATSAGGPAITGNSTTESLYVVTGLTNGQPYYFRVQAIGSGNQWSAYSTEVSAVPNPAANIGNITGQVAVNIAGYSNLGVRNAAVTLQGTAYTTTTDGNGKFTLINVPYGNYTMIVSAPGMDTQTQAISLANPGQSATIPPLVVSQPPPPPPGVKGDVNDDKHVGIDDALYILQMLTDLRE